MRATMIAVSDRCYHMAWARLSPGKVTDCGALPAAGALPVRNGHNAFMKPDVVTSKVPEVTLGFWIIKVADAR